MLLTKILTIRSLQLLTTSLIVVISLRLDAQEVDNMRLFEFKFGVQTPMADMKERFGGSNSFGLALQQVSLKNKWLFGIDGHYFFGSTVKQDVLTLLRTEDGSIISLDGTSADVVLKERAYYLGLHTGKLFHTGSNKKKLTGVLLQVGAGILQHKIRIQDNYNNVVALEKKYHSGYDRLSNGPATHIGLGYQYQSPKNNFHFHILADVFAARTSNKREIDFATGTRLEEKRWDVLTGLSLAYIVTISRQEKSDHIYY